MSTERKPTKGGVEYWPTDWAAQCEALCRKTGKQCPHTCNVQVPSTIAAHAPMDEKWHSVVGRPVRLCESHHRSFTLRAKKLLALPLIHGGHLSPYNHFGYGSVIIAQDRIEFHDQTFKTKISPAWGWISWKGNVPAGLLKRVPPYTPPASLDSIA